MDQAAQISLLEKLVHDIDTNTNTSAMADAPRRNEVTAYTCPERHERANGPAPVREAVE